MKILTEEEERELKSNYFRGRFNTVDSLIGSVEQTIIKKLQNVKITNLDMELINEKLQSPEFKMQQVFALFQQTVDLVIKKAVECESDE